MITIKYVGATRNPNLVRSAGDAGWLTTPIGAGRLRRLRTGPT